MQKKILSEGVKLPNHLFLALKGTTALVVIGKLERGFYFCNFFDYSCQLYMRLK